MDILVQETLEVNETIKIFWMKLDLIRRTVQFKTNKGNSSLTLEEFDTAIDGNRLDTQKTIIRRATVAAVKKLANYEIRLASIPEDPFSQEPEE